MSNSTRLKTTACSQLLNIVDRFTRECPAIVVERSIDADRLVATLDRMVVERGAPTFGRFDNGLEFVANAVAGQRRWLDLHRPRLASWQNAWIESFNGRMRDEFRNAQPYVRLGCA